MRLVKLLVIFGIIAGAVYIVTQYSSAIKTAETAAQGHAERKGDAPRLEERYGFTADQVGP